MKPETKAQSFLRNFAFVFCLLGAVYFLSGQIAAWSGGLGNNFPGQVASVTMTGKFDGHALYKASFEALRDYHKELADPAKRAAFAAEWEHKFDTTGDLDTEAGADAAVAKMMESLGQRFDYYFGVDATKAEHEQTESKLVGIGISIRLADQESLFKGLPDQATRADVDNILRISKGHELTVEGTLEGGPSDGVLKDGDIITHVDGQALDGMKLSDAVSKIRGDEGTEVKLTIERVENGAKQTFERTIKRAKVPVKVVHSKDLGDGITYVKVDHFVSRSTAREFAQALDKAVKAGSKGLVIDLRGNPGGELNTVLAMSAMIIPDGTILVTEAREGDEIGKNQFIVNRDFVTSVSGTDVEVGQRPTLIVPEDMPIVVLVNNGSASASEILSGALQAHHRALIVGKPTHGKGVGQTVIPLPFGRSMHVTSFEFLPGGKRMDWIGIIPDVEVDVDRAAKSDTQLDTAVTNVKRMIGEADALRKKADELKKQNHADFDKELQQRNQQRSELLQK